MKLVPGVHNAVKSGFFELYFLFCLSWTHKWKRAYSFLSLGSYLNMYHDYASLKKEHFLPVFTERRACFSIIILRDAKSIKCELKEHLWERASGGGGGVFVCVCMCDDSTHRICTLYNIHVHIQWWPKVLSAGGFLGYIQQNGCTPVIL